MTYKHYDCFSLDSELNEKAAVICLHFIKYFILLNFILLIKLFEKIKKNKCEVLPRLELGSLDSESRVLTITP